MPPFERVPEKKPAVDVDEELPDEPVAVLSADGRLEQLGRRELQLPMDALRPRFAGCKAVENFEGTIYLRLRIGRSGGVESVSTLPPHEHTRMARCVREIARSAGFPKFRGTRIPVVELTYPVMF